MRKDAPLLLVLTLAIVAPSRLAAESRMLYGKPAAWENSELEAPQNLPVVVAETMETPNQMRRRLGQPIQASFPAEELGQAEETPNHRRARLAMTAQAGTTESYAEDPSSIDEDDDNRLASAH